MWYFLATHLLCGAVMAELANWSRSKQGNLGISRLAYLGVILFGWLGPLVVIFHLVRRRRGRR